MKTFADKLAYDIARLKRCEDEPIGHSGAIQPQGFLVVIDRQTFAIQAMSHNWETIDGLESVTDALGRNLFDVLELDRRSADCIRAMSSVGMEVPCDVRICQEPVPVVRRLLLHRQEASIILEFEPATDLDLQYAVATVGDFSHEIKQLWTDVEACQKAAEFMKIVSGYERVMIYQFDKNWHGQVIAEAREPHLDPFLYLKYPASDIPPQARQLFFENQSRLIVDVQSEPSPIVTSAAISRGQLNLSRCLLRSVSPFHIEYLKNMGVRASFAAPIRVNNKLWGLIACHHYTRPMHPDHEVRSAFQIMAQILSGKVAETIDARRMRIKQETLAFTQSFLGKVASGNEAIESFIRSKDPLLALTDSHGAYVRIGSRVECLGHTPDESTLDKLLTRLQQLDALDVWSSDSLVKDLGLEPDPNIAGALAIPFSLGFEDTLIWFRCEEEQEIRWGGADPDSPSKHADPFESIGPRKSFQEWRQKLKNHSRPWSESDVECGQYFLFGFVQAMFAKAHSLSVAYQELQRISRARDEFISTLSHELRNPLNVIVGWVELLKDSVSLSVEEKNILEIIGINTQLQLNLINDLLDVARITSGKLRLHLIPEVNISEIVKEVVRSAKQTSNCKSIQIDTQYDAAVKSEVDPDRLRQVVWNLVSNAIKFTQENGRIDIKLWQDDEHYHIVVADDGIGIKPTNLGTVFERFSQAGVDSASLGGLGLGLSIVKHVVELHGGTVEAYSEGLDRGARFTVHLPIIHSDKRK